MESAHPDDTLSRHWGLDPSVLFLNHGSFGACPRVVLDVQARWRERMERRPVHFFVDELPAELDRVRGAIGALVGAAPDDLALVTNATAGVNTVLRSLDFRPDDELLVTDQEYNASRNALDYAARRAGASVVVVPIPFPTTGPDEVVSRIVARVTARTRLALVDHVTSQTGLVMPAERIVAELAARGVDTLVDGAHAPGMLPLDLDRMGAAFYTGNCHKWLCAPKGAGILHVRRDRQEQVVPLAISHGANVEVTDRSRFRLLFDWTGTCDPSPWLAVPDAIAFLGSLHPGGLEELRDRNRALALRARDAICQALGIPKPAPDEMIGSLVAFPLPAGTATKCASPLYVDPLHDQLLEKYSIQVPVMSWPQPPARVIRISAQAYNSIDQYERLGTALRELLAAERTGPEAATR